LAFERVHTYNLGLACTEDGLLLGRTPLIERRDGRFVVRERFEIARLLKYAFPQGCAVERIMPGLATVAAALNANNPALARIAAVHLQIPDLPSAAARDATIAEDALIKYARDEGGSTDWNAALHPRTGTPPNPGWFVPTDGGSHNESSQDESSGGQSRLRVAANEGSSRHTDVPPTGDNWVRLPPREDRIDELADFLEWLANAKPEDEKPIRREIKRYFYDAGDHIGGDRLTHALRDTIDPGVDRETRQEILNGLEDLSRSDPTIVGQYENLFYLISSFLLPGGPRKIPGGAPKSPAIPKERAAGPTEPPPAVGLTPKDAPSKIWSYGWGKRGQEIHNLFSDKSLPPGFPVIDNFTDGVATSIKSIDLRAATYQDASRLAYRLQKYVNDASDFMGRTWANNEVRLSDIQGRALQLIVPKGSMSATQRDTIEALRTWAKSKNHPVGIIVTEF
jgi:hypothetical protein